MPITIKPAVKSTPAQKAKTAKAFKKWSHSPAAKKLAMIRKDPKKYAAHLTNTIKKVQGWIKSLSEKPRTPANSRLMANHKQRIESLKATIAKLRSA